MRKTAVTILAGIALSLTAGCGTADPYNSGDPTHHTTPRIEGDTAFPSAMATPHATPKHVVIHRYLKKGARHR